jgi:conjugative transfer region protein TrbK
MESKTIARVGAIAFVAIAITMTALQLRDDPKPVPPDAVVTVMEPDGDPLPAVLRDCAALGEAGARHRGCLAAWAESRRRFLAPGSEGKAAPEIKMPPTPADAAGSNVAISSDEVQ